MSQVGQLVEFQGVYTTGRKHLVILSTRSHICPSTSNSHKIQFSFLKLSHKIQFFIFKIQRCPETMFSYDFFSKTHLHLTFPTLWHPASLVHKKFERSMEDKKQRGLTRRLSPLLNGFLKMAWGIHQSQKEKTACKQTREVEIL